MGFMDEMKKLIKPYDDDGADDFDDFDEPEQKPAAKPSKPVSAFDDTSFTSSSDRKNKVVNINTTTQLQVVLVKPDRFDNVSEIAEHLRERCAVVLNLEQTNKEVARRLVDFLSGCAYALDGKIKKVAVSTYIITPYNVDIVGDLIDELENNGLYL
ncbi:MAG: cell division protein SepF [Oscillospiraceae bacterium]|nr:cell division protein SepF [Oscillospiraceae bacterium]